MRGASKRARYKAWRVVGACLVAAIFASYSIALAFFLATNPFNLPLLFYGTAIGGTYGLLAAVPVCLVVGYPVTRWMESRGFTSFSSAVITGAGVAGVGSIGLVALLLAITSGDADGDLFPFILGTVLTFQVVGILDGLLARLVLGRPQVSTSDNA
ncbi:hypothetical protein NHF40_03640 [Maricaulaceae bacterium EIL42A08]|nr:hypothetical protein [Maricaulaceae bacterium EIL42A08]